MKKPDLFVQIGSSFFNNDILPQSNAACAQNFFKRRFLRAARNASTHEQSVQNSAPKLLFIENFCRDFCARQEVCGFCDGNLQTVNDRAKTQRQHCIAQLISRANARQKRADREARVRAQRAYKQYATKTARSATKVCAVFRARLLFADAELGKNFGYNLFRSGFARNFAERFPCFLHGNGKQIQRRGIDIRQRGF